MAVIFYLPDFGKKGETLLQNMTVELPRRNIEIYRFFPGLEKKTSATFVEYPGGGSVLSHKR